MENKQHLYEPTILLREGKEWIKGFTMERPNPSKWGYIEYKEELEKFLASTVEYQVCEGSVKEFKIFVGTKFLEFEPKLGIKEAVEQSVRIDDLADRLEVVEICSYTKKDCSPGCAFCDYDAVKVIRLRPEVNKAKCPTCGHDREIAVGSDGTGFFVPVKKESQEELWIAALKTSPVREMLEIDIIHTSYIPKMIDALKQQFTIKRNP